MAMRLEERGVKRCRLVADLCHLRQAGFGHAGSRKRLQSLRMMTMAGRGL